MAELKYKFTNDTLFKMLFVKYQDLLKRFAAVLLGVKLEDIWEFEVKNPEMPPEMLDDKFCRLDILMTVNGQLVNLEIQVKDEHDYPERSLFQWARVYSSGISKGSDYSALPKTIFVSIVAFQMFDCEEYHSEFGALEVTRHERLTDRMSLHYFELPKLPEQTDAGNELMLWLKLFGAVTEDDLSNIEKIGGTVMSQVIGAYRHVSATPEFRELERKRFEATCNEASALYGRAIDIAINLKAMGMSNEDIAKATKVRDCDIQRFCK